MPQQKNERAIMHFCQRNGKWTKSNVEIQIDRKAFSEGSFRLAFHAKMYDNNMKFRSYVCKFAKEADTPRELYFNDIKAQVLSSLWADRFNELNPPKTISVVECFVLELVERRGRPLCGCEALVHGDFKKHNNNVGAVANWTPENQEQKMDMELAQAFSHFTYEHSRHRLLICDIQGVGACYTDPQVHTLSTRGFGGGNLGATGIKAFLLRHKCNSMCAAIRLPRIEAKDLNGNWMDCDGASYPFRQELEIFEDDTKRIYTKSKSKMTIGRPSASISRATSPAPNHAVHNTTPTRPTQPFRDIPEHQSTSSYTSSHLRIRTDPVEQDPSVAILQSSFGTNEPESAVDDYANWDPEEEALMKEILATDLDM